MASWNVIAPITNGFSSALSKIEGRHELGCGVAMQELPEWFSDSTILKWYGYHDSSQLAGAVFGFIASYEADSLFEKEAESDAGPAQMRKWHAVQRITRANLALWLANPAPISFRVAVIFREGTGTPSPSHSEQWPELVVHPSDMDSILEEADIAVARQLADRLAQLRRESSIWIAESMLWRALTTCNWHIRYLCYWVAFEALFGCDDAREITYRLSHRAGFFLGDDRSDAEEISKRCGKAYSWRSKIIHGRRLKKADEETLRTVSGDMERFLRDALSRLLLDDELRQLFEGGDREAYLDSLIFK